MRGLLGKVCVCMNIQRFPPRLEGGVGSRQSRGGKQVFRLTTNEAAVCFARLKLTICSTTSGWHNSRVRDPRAHRDVK